MLPSNAAGQLADFFASTGDTQTADTIAGVQQALGAVSNIAQGFAQGGLIGGIGATIGEAINFIGQGLAAEARHQEALKEIAKARLAFQRQYNLALLEQKLLMEDCDEHLRRTRDREGDQRGERLPGDLCKAAG